MERWQPWFTPPPPPPPPRDDKSTMAKWLPGDGLNILQDICKILQSWSWDIGLFNDYIVLNFNGHLYNVVAEMPVKFQSNWAMLSSYIKNVRLHHICITYACLESDFVGDENVMCNSWENKLLLRSIIQSWELTYIECVQELIISSWCVPCHTMDMLWEKFQWILPLYMKRISFQSKASVVCSVTAAIFIDFCLKKLNVFSQHIG